MSMNNNNHNLVSMIQSKSNEELVSESIAHDMNRFSEVNKTNELIEVSDDDDDSESESGSESDSESDSGSESDDDIEGGNNNNNNNSTTKKILFTGNHESHLVEHLEGPDVKIIELSHPLYSKNDNEMYNKNTNDDEDEDASSSNNDSDNDSEGDSESVTSEMDGPHQPSEGHEIHEIHEIKENTVNFEMNNQIDLETDNISEVFSVDNSLDNLLVKAVFKNKENKENKDSETHTDYNSMNVQTLRQLLKNKLASVGSSMSESSINKLTKKELIKHLS